MAMKIHVGYAQRAQDLALFTRHIAGAMQARAPLAEVVGSFADEAGTRSMQEGVRNVALRLEAGATLSSALEESPRLFPDSYRRVVRMAEESQTLPAVMGDLATTMEDGVTMHEQLRRISIYPTFIMGVLFLVSIFVIQRVVPQVTDIYRHLPMGGNAESTPTVGLDLFPMIALTGVLIGFLWLLGVGAGLSWSSYRQGRWMLSLPLVGPALRMAETARFVRHLGLMLENRIPLNEAVGLLAESTVNGYMRSALVDFEQRLAKGEALGAMISGQPVFPPTLSVMIRSAQERGQLAESLQSLAGFYRHRAEHSIRLVKEFFEPLLLIIVGFLVAWMAFGMYIPILRIGRTISNVDY